MKALVTGLGGTLAPYLRSALERGGGDVIGWDRAAVSPDDPGACLAYLRRVRPDAVFHLAMDSERWAALMARFCDERGAGFLFTSTVMVFADEPDGPHRVEDEPTSTEDYGLYKIRCERAIREASGSAIVARIGCQIGPRRGGNNMLEHHYAQHEKNGRVRASTRWKPACSFMPDTADSLIALLDRGEAGMYHVDSNARANGGDGFNYHEIAQRLNRMHGAGWIVEVDDSFVRDQRLIDERVAITPLTDRLQ